MVLVWGNKPSCDANKQGISILLFRGKRPQHTMKRFILNIFMQVNKSCHVVQKLTRFWLFPSSHWSNNSFLKVFINIYEQKSMTSNEYLLLPFNAWKNNMRHFSFPSVSSGIVCTIFLPFAPGITALRKKWCCSSRVVAQQGSVKSTKSLDDSKPETGQNYKKDYCLIPWGQIRSTNFVMSSSALQIFFCISFHFPKLRLIARP